MDRTKSGWLTGAAECPLSDNEHAGGFDIHNMIPGTQMGSVMYHGAEMGSWFDTGV